MPLNFYITHSLAQIKPAPSCSFQSGIQVLVKAKFTSWYIPSSWTCSTNCRPRKKCLRTIDDHTSVNPFHFCSAAVSTPSNKTNTADAFWSALIKGYVTSAAIVTDTLHHSVTTTQHSGTDCWNNLSHGDTSTKIGTQVLQNLLSHKSTLANFKNKMAAIFQDGRHSFQYETVFALNIVKVKTFSWSVHQNICFLTWGIEFCNQNFNIIKRYSDMMTIIWTGTVSVTLPNGCGISICCDRSTI